MKIKVYTYGYDNDSGYGTHVFGRKDERDVALREAILSYIDGDHSEFDDVSVRELYSCVTMSRDGVYFCWDEHVVEVDVITP